MNSNTTNNSGSKSGMLKWAKKGGILIFLFFLLKGIGWLVLLGLLLFGILDEATIDRIKHAVPLF